MDGQTLFHPRDKTDALNKFFKINISSITISQNLTPTGLEPKQCMDIIQITENGVLDQ